MSERERAQNWTNPLLQPARMRGAAAGNRARLETCVVLVQTDYIGPHPERGPQNRVRFSHGRRGNRRSSCCEGTWLAAPGPQAVPRLAQKSERVKTIVKFSQRSHQRTAKLTLRSQRVGSTLDIVKAHVVVLPAHCPVPNVPVLPMCTEDGGQSEPEERCSVRFNGSS